MVRADGPTPFNVQADHGSPLFLRRDTCHSHGRGGDRLNTDECVADDRLGALVEFRILGPLELWADGRVHPLGTPKERCVLASLVSALGEPVTVDVLMRQVWEGDPPDSANETLQAYVSRLRSRLRSAVGGRAHIDRGPRTYRLSVDPEAIDLYRFRRLHKQAKAVARSGSPRQAVELLLEAEGLWRGEPLGEFAGHWVITLRGRLEEELRSVQDLRISLALDLGGSNELIGELREMSEQRPFAEPVAKHLMLALYRSGREADALDAYRQIDSRFREELGLSPSRELQDLHGRMLRGDASLQAPSTALRNNTAPANTLLRDNPDFTGREEQLRVLLRAAEPGSTALPLFVLHGMPGVGKTTLAVHAAHLLRDEYPDGHLYLDLRAHSRHGQPWRDPFDALADLLRFIDYTAELPATLDERAAVWRKQVANLRLLLVLDDAHDAEQVRPLLPGTPKCCVIVTSRHSLAGLEGARSLALDVLSTAEASAMFTRIIGSSRAADKSAVLDVVRMCDRHPLAIHVVANRLRHREAWEVRDLADRLALSSEPLEEIDGPPGIVTAFSCSYAELSETSQRLLRRVAQHPGPDIGLHAAAAVAGTDLATAGRALEELLDCHLIEEPWRDRFALHGLMKQFLLRMGRRDDTQEERRCAVDRLVSHYLATAYDAAALVVPQRRYVPEPATWPPSPAPRSPLVGDQSTAEVWLDMERASITAVARLAISESLWHAKYFPLVLAALAAVAEEEGDYAAAREHLERGAAVYRRLGAIAEAEHAEGRLRLLEPPK